MRVYQEAIPTRARPVYLIRPPITLRMHCPSSTTSSSPGVWSPYHSHAEPAREPWGVNKTVNPTEEPEIEMLGEAISHPSTVLLRSTDHVSFSVAVLAAHPGNAGRLQEVGVKLRYFPLSSLHGTQGYASYAKSHSRYSTRAAHV